MVIQFYDGVILFDTGQIAMNADCCCGDAPCTNCTGAQNDAVVTLPERGFEDCCGIELAQGFNGLFAWSDYGDFGGTSVCRHRFLGGPTDCGDYGPLYWRWELTYTVATGLWTSELRAWVLVQGQPVYVVLYVHNTASFTCDQATGLITGTATLSGAVGPTFDCTDRKSGV